MRQPPSKRGSRSDQLEREVETLRLQQERSRHALEVLYNISLACRGRTSFKEIFEAIYAQLSAIFPLDAAYIALCDVGRPAYFRANLMVDQGTFEYKEDMLHGMLTGQLVRGRKPLLFRDLLEQLNQVEGEPQSFGNLEKRSRSWLGVPLLVGADAIGVISIQSYAVGLYDENDLGLLQQIGNVMAVVMENARLSQQQSSLSQALAEQVEVRTRELTTLSTLASELALQQPLTVLLQRSLDLVIPLLGFEGGSVRLLDPAHRELVLFAQTGFPEHYRQSSQRLGLDQSLPGQAVLENRPVVVASGVRDQSAYGAPFEALLSVPLRVGERVLGVLSLVNSRRQTFDEQKVDLAQAIGNQLAIAIENARLFEESVTRIEQEMDIARSIQRNLFPRTLPQLEGLLIAAECIPAYETGGDFYDFVQLGDRRVALMVGDASGKSIPAAMLMAIARSIARSEARDHETPQAVIRETNRWIAQDVPPHTFVALCYATIDMRGRRLALANAGQLFPLLRRSSGSVEYLETPGPRIPLGILPNTHYAAREVDLSAGDLLVFYTDGIVEARNSAGELFGFERLEALVERAGDLSPTALLDQIMWAIAGFVGSARQHDDMTLVVVRVA